MKDTMQEVVQFIEENDVKFIRLAFCDLFGTQKNISIMPGELSRAFSSGISFDADALDGFGEIAHGELLLFPDPGTLSILPWRPSQGRVVRFYCNVKKPDGTPFEADGREILRAAVERARGMNLTVKVGTESEFYLFERDDEGRPTHCPHDHAGYFDIAPLDRAENVRRQICLTLEDMGIRPERSHHEQGPGQNEIDFRYAEPVEAADNFVTYKSVVKTMAQANGLYASFLPKPLRDQPGSGLHVNLSLFRNGKNLLGDAENEEVWESFLAGILERARELSVFLNPLANSYTRLGKCEAPNAIAWSRENRSSLVRIPAAAGEWKRFELRSTDAAVNPYLAFALLIQAGLDGIEQKMTLSAPREGDLFTEEGRKGLDMLPASLGEALVLAEESKFVARVLTHDVRQAYAVQKKSEWIRYETAFDKAAADDELYFGKI